MLMFGASVCKSVYMCVSLYAFHFTSMGLFVNECVCVFVWMVVPLVLWRDKELFFDCDWAKLSCWETERER